MWQSQIVFSLTVFTYIVKCVLQNEIDIIWTMTWDFLHEEVSTIEREKRNEIFAYNRIPF